MSDRIKFEIICPNDHDGADTFLETPAAQAVAKARAQDADC